MRGGGRLASRDPTSSQAPPGGAPRAAGQGARPLRQGRWGNSTRRRHGKVRPPPRSSCSLARSRSPQRACAHPPASMRLACQMDGLAVEALVGHGVDLRPGHLPVDQDELESGGLEAALDRLAGVMALHVTARVPPPALAVRTLERLEYGRMNLSGPGVLGRLTVPAE